MRSLITAVGVRLELLSIAEPGEVRPVGVSKRSQESAGMAATRSSWKATFAVIGAPPLTISLTRLAPTPAHRSVAAAEARVVHPLREALPRRVSVLLSTLPRS